MQIHIALLKSQNPIHITNPKVSFMMLSMFVQEGELSKTYSFAKWAWFIDKCSHVVTILYASWSIIVFYYMKSLNIYFLQDNVMSDDDLPTYKASPHVMMA